MYDIKTLCRLFLYLACAAHALAQWVQPEVEQFTNTESPLGPANQSLALDRDGWLHVAWLEFDFTTWRLLYSTNSPDGEWQVAPDTVSLASEFVREPALAVNPLTLQPSILYATESNRIVMATKTETSWQREDVFVHQNSLFWSPVLAADSLGRFHGAWIVFDDGEYKLNYRTLAPLGLLRVLEEAELGAFGGGAAPKLSIESGGAAHIAYRYGDLIGDTAHVSQVFHAWNSSFDDPVWNVERVPGLPQSSASPTIKVDGNGVIHLAVMGASNQDPRVYYGTRVGLSWSAMEVITDVGLNCGYPALALDHMGNPYVISSEVIGSVETGLLTYSARLEGGGWFNTVIPSEDWAYQGFVVDQSLHGVVFVLGGYNSPSGDTEFWLVRSDTPLTAVPGIEPDEFNLNFGEVAVFDTSARSIVITNTGTADLEIQEFITEDGFAAVLSGNSIVPPGGTSTVDVLFFPIEDVPYVGTLTIHSNAPQSPTFISLSGSGIFSAEIDAEPEFIDFGEVVIHTTATLALQITNPGDVDLHIFDLDVPTDFAVTPLADPVISPGDERELMVSFTPSVAGVFEGDVQIFCNIPSGVLDVPLAGIGVLTSGAEENSSIPVSFGVAAYPNPFNPTVTLSIALPVSGEVAVDIFSTEGRLVQSFRRFAAASVVNVEWNAQNLASGTYFAHVRAGQVSDVVPLVLLK